MRRTERQRLQRLAVGTDGVCRVCGRGPEHVRTAVQLDTPEAREAHCTRMVTRLDALPKSIGARGVAAWLSMSARTRALTEAVKLLDKADVERIDEALAASPHARWKRLLDERLAEIDAMKGDASERNDSTTA